MSNPIQDAIAAARAGRGVGKVVQPLPRRATRAFGRPNRVQELIAEILAAARDSE